MGLREGGDASGNVSTLRESTERKLLSSPLDITVSGCGMELGQASAKDGADTESGKETRNRLLGMA